MDIFSLREELRIPVATQEDGSIALTAVLRYLGLLQNPVGVDITLPIQQHPHDKLLILFSRNYRGSFVEELSKLLLAA